ncbi:MAG: hypothetical protein K8S98_12505 [Planctomycetes bacterium]|nr:hypothetical protein [Planctomycetota bacterium]
MQKKFQDLLHQYKLQVFHVEHDKTSVGDLTKECLHVTEDVLKQKFHYHFHGLADANRAEIINMVNNYTREAILPQVVEKLVMRQIKLEKRMQALVEFNQRLLEILSEDRTPEKVAR